ncbi:MAG: HTH-type transcriptional repressor PurR [Verrucomicrobiae bacterium]|nr:HTH-type transcriptional repressor PurR [Verrucomicrobiae bacterium]
MITQRQIAERLELSLATVANILSERPGLRYAAATRERVLKTAAEMGYQPNRAAQTVRRRRSNLIGIVHFGAGIEAAHKANLALAADVCARGYDYLAVDMNWHGGSVERVIDELIQARVEGVIISHIQEVFQKEHVDMLTRVGIPVVVVNGERRSGASIICDDVYSAFQALGRHLIQLGHRRILHLWPAVDRLEENRSIGERLKGFRSAIEERGKWVSFSEEEFFTAWPDQLPATGGVMGVTVIQDMEKYSTLNKPVYSFCERLFAASPLPDAIVCTNDVSAIELIAAGLEHGVRVPADVAVTGYDNDRIGEYPAFGLTTAEQDISRICAATVAEICLRIADPHRPPRQQSFPSRLILRTSCGMALAAQSRSKATTTDTVRS